MKHEGDLIAKPGLVYECEEISGSLDASGADTKTAFPKLTKENDEKADGICKEALRKGLLKNGLILIDGILAALSKRRGNVYRVVLCGKQRLSYIVADGRGNYSHGATLAEARKGLIYKLSSRDTSAFKAWKLDTVITIAESIQAYRAITGACEQGTRHFCEQQGELPNNMTVADAIKRTKGQYGSQQFEAFFGKA